jgi:HEAT repeat protein
MFAAGVIAQEPSRSVPAADEPFPEELATLSPILDPSVWKVHLHSKSVTIRRAAANRLASHFLPEDPSFLPALIRALKDEDETVLESVLSMIALMRSKAQDALPSLPKLLKSPNPKIRYLAIKSIVNIGPKDVHAPLFKTALKDEDRNVRVWAAGGLWNLGQNEKEARKLFENSLTSADQKEHLEAIVVLVELQLKAVPLLEELIKNKEPVLRQSAIGVIGELRSPQIPASTLKLLEGALQDENDEIVRCAVFALGRLREQAKRSVPLVIRCLKHSNPGVRCMAASSLSCVESAADVAIPALTEALDDKDRYVREAAQESIETLKQSIEKHKKAEEK